MRTHPRRIALSLACLALAGATACTPSFDVDHQYLDETTNPELGLHPDATGMAGFLARFATGQMLPLTSNAVTTIWTSGTTFVTTVSGGGGSVPVSLSGTAVDSNADLIADELDVTVNYALGPAEDRVLLRTDPFSDYKCFEGAGNCTPAFGPPECSFVPLGDDFYDVTAYIPFVDADGDLNPNPNHNAGFRFARYGYFGTSITPFAIPETIGTWVLTGTGTTSGTLTLFAGALDLTPYSETIHDLGFRSWDQAGHLGNEVFCKTPVG